LVHSIRVTGNVRDAGDQSSFLTLTTLDDPDSLRRIDISWDNKLGTFAIPALAQGDYLLRGCVTRDQQAYCADQILHALDKDIAASLSTSPTLPRSPDRYRLKAKRPRSNCHTAPLRPSLSTSKNYTCSLRRPEPSARLCPLRDPIAWLYKHRPAITPSPQGRTQRSRPACNNRVRLCSSARGRLCQGWRSTLPALRDHDA
jgi:hypothetical protein